jgi:hypothetical protein
MSEPNHVTINRDGVVMCYVEEYDDGRITLMFSKDCPEDLQELIKSRMLAIPGVRFVHAERVDN